MSYLLGIDAGTTSVKSVLFNFKGEVIVSSLQEYSLSTPKPDYVEFNPEIYWVTCKRSVKELLKRSKISPDEIVSVAISSQGETLIVLDKDGKPSRNAIVWLDNRSKEEAEVLKKKIWRRRGL